jgi:hypothetical protein
MIRRQNLGFNPHSWIEIKHVGDTAETYKTRMYHLGWHGVTQHIARAGLQLEADETLEMLSSSNFGLHRVRGCQWTPTRLRWFSSSDQGGRHDNPLRLRCSQGHLAPTERSMA